jgi:hypothetical protein
VLGPVLTAARTFSVTSGSSWTIVQMLQAFYRAFSVRWTRLSVKKCGTTKKHFSVRWIRLSVKKCGTTKKHFSVRWIRLAGKNAA